MNTLPAVFPSLQYSATKQDLVSHAGTRVLADFIDALDFRRACEDRLGQFVPARATHRPGAMVGQLAVMLAAGGDCVSDLDALRAHRGAYGPVASNATYTRLFDRINPADAVFDHGMTTLSRQLRSRVWAAAGARNPEVWASADQPLIIDVDATLVDVHSDKEDATGTYKRGYGYSPFIASIDYTNTPAAPGPTSAGEVLAVIMRPGSAGANSAADHIRVFDAAIATLPDGFFDTDGTLIGEKILVRADSAGPSRAFLDYLDTLGVQFSMSYRIPPVRTHHLDAIGDKQFWQPTINTDGNDRDNAWVVNVTDVVPMPDYPAGTNLYLRAEPLHPGARPSLLDADGHRITAFTRELAALARPRPGRPPPGPWPSREPDQTFEERRPGQVPVL